MKKLLTLCLLTAALAANAQGNDTLTIHGPRKVRIITGDSIQKVKVYGSENDSQYTYETSIQLVDSNYVSETFINKDWGFTLGSGQGRNGSGLRASRFVSSHFGVGLCTAVGADDPVSVPVGSSWELFWTIAEANRFFAGSHHGFSMGFGIGWRNYRMTDFTRFAKADDGIIYTEPYPAGSEPKFSRIKVFSLNVPLMWKYRFARSGTFSLGVVLNFNTYGSIKTRYEDADGKSHKDVAKHIHQKPFTLDLMSTLNIYGIGAYCKYSPMSTLQSAYSDNSNFQSLSFGVYL